MIDFNGLLEKYGIYESPNRNLLIECEIVDSLNESWKKSDETFVPTKSLLKLWFDEFNRLYFNGVLPSIELLVDDCGKTTWGHFSALRRYYKKSGKWVDPFDPKKCHIRISNLYEGTEYNLKNVLIHEMVHYYIHFHYGYLPARHHGKEFLYEAAKINSVSEWNITPTNDYVENEVSDQGIEKYKNRIKDEYIICIINLPDKWGKFHAIRTNEKYIDLTIKTFKRWNCEFTWYKIKVENPRFGIMTTVNRGNSFNYIASGNSEEDVLKKINDSYSLVGSEKFEPSFEIDNNKTLYLCILHTTDGKSWYAAKMSNTELIRKVVDKYRQHPMHVYKVTNYNDKFAIENDSKGKFKSVAFAKSEEYLYTILKERYNLVKDNFEEIM